MLFLALAPGRALASDALKIELVAKALEGAGQPELVVIAEAELKRVVLEVKRSIDGKALKVEAGPIHAGRAHHFRLELPTPGAARFSGRLRVVLENGETGEMPIDVAVELLEPLRLTVLPERVLLDKRSLVVSASRAVKEIEISVMSDTGAPLGTSITRVDRGAEGGSESPGGGGGAAEVACKWDQREGTVMRISVKALDVDGFFGGIDLFPWRVDIPHQEINFTSGSSEIRTTEVSKIEDSWGQITAAVEKYGKLATIQLFIAGHTDTVGDKASNRALSNRRAQAIGHWFSKRGVKIGIRVAGFGEDSLAVDTQDESDEPRNRRAEYIVAVDPPRIAGRNDWQPLSPH